MPRSWRDLPDSRVLLTSEHVMPPRARVIIDNDFAGDPDGLFQLAHHMLCTSVDVVQVISSRLREVMISPDRDAVAEGAAAADEVLALVGSAMRAVPGARAALTSGTGTASV